MHVLIIYANPNPNSLNAAMLAQVKRGLEDSNHSYTLIDLYEEHFDPVLQINENKKRSEMKCDKVMKKYQDLVREADHMIFLYPLWWYGPPAILKGFFDRVFVSGIAYTYEGALPKGLLKAKSAWVMYTCDSPGWFVQIIRRNAEWIVMRDGILKFCGIQKVKRFRFAGVKSSSEAKRKRWLDEIYSRVRYQLKNGQSQANAATRK
ncbi:NAD(P)H-dependent oxidoreductase [Brevibacillus ruminantium]|uniref:NAD(P)H-dependent oxidoreductase n=1 Tax=Brevibacillus ruminantium TaxID=2950604 RepID=A0ABY4W828_9BACL|nr:NAD(P)H-dependent oxidoreductase [Brevibacillus ruminantium]USG63335.1 NAD(P)H-dependent oxidoreductase [Brevibacillus ruminantium]